MQMNLQHHFDDLPETVTFNTSVALDTEAMGLNPHRDRLCVVQLSAGDGTCHVVQLNRKQTFSAPNLCHVLQNPNILKIFHFARFDVALLEHTFNITLAPIYCTKIASKIARTSTEQHGLKELCRDLLGVTISKEQQTSDWGNPNLSPQQLHYAGTDVLYLHHLKDKLDALLERENRHSLAQACFDFLPTCARLDLLGYTPGTLFDH